MSKYQYETERLIIRPIKNAEEELQLATLLAEYHNIPEAAELEAKTNAGLYNFDTPCCNYIILDKSTNAMVGQISLSLHPDMLAEFSCYLIKSFRGQGYGPEARIKLGQESAKYIGQTVNAKEYFLCEFPPVVKEYSGELKGLFGITEDISNYPSLSLSIKSGLKVESLLGRYIVVSTSAIENPALTEAVKGLSHAYMSIAKKYPDLLWNEGEQLPEMHDHLIKVIQEAGEPHTIISAAKLLGLKLVSHYNLHDIVMDAATRLDVSTEAMAASNHILQSYSALKNIFKICDHYFVPEGDNAPEVMMEGVKLAGDELDSHSLPLFCGIIGDSML
jgi:hypothetical protein